MSAILLGCLLLVAVAAVVGAFFEFADGGTCREAAETAGIVGLLASGGLVVIAGVLAGIAMIATGIAGLAT